MRQRLFETVYAIAVRALMWRARFWILRAVVQSSL
jgi:hypothetical protein